MHRSARRGVDTVAVSFTEWADGAEPRIRHALTASFGPEIGVDATAEAMAHAWERWDDMLEGPIVGTVSVLDELRERGYDTFLLGNWGREEFERARPGLTFLDGFRDVILSGDCGILKPDPGIFELAEEQFSLNPVQTVNHRPAESIGFLIIQCIQGGNFRLQSL